MLKQILRDMYVDPEILAGLDETYKQTLFCKMREEQIRRWKIWDEEQQSKQLDGEIVKKTNRKRKHVDFRLGEDGEPWVWVMGEHSNDQTIENILEEEIKQKARQLAEKEFLQNNANINDEKIEINNFQLQGKDQNNQNLDLDIYCAVDELKKDIKTTTTTTSVQQLEPQTLKKLENNNSNDSQNENVTNRLRNFEISNSSKTKFKTAILQPNKFQKPEIGKVSVRIAQWEQRSIGERTSEILQEIQLQKQEIARVAEETAAKTNALWEEQERKAKEAEVKIREIARRARDEHRKSLLSGQTIKLEPNLIRPPSQEAVVEWYINYEKPRKAGLNIDNRPYKWFHGLLERTKAEVLLMNEEQGTYLVRLSDKIWGYAISYKDIDRCKHYLINVRNGKYKFLGQNQLQHDNLDELLKYHADVPITTVGMELLIKPCSKSIQDEQLGGIL